MGKTAFVFAGQGSQHPGMGADLMTHPAAAAVFQALDGVRPGTSRQCFAGSEETLARTKNTQPCLFAVETAAAAVLAAGGVRADMAAGFSLGELSALAYAGAGELTEMFAIVCRRGELMQAAAEKHPAKMAAVLKLGAPEVEALCSRSERVYPVNYNCPGQITVSAAEEELPAFTAAVKAAGGRVMPLKVGGGFHSPFMNEAAAAFAAYLTDRNLRVPEIPTYANATAAPYPEDVKGMLARQIVSPVRWEASVRAMIAAGADVFVEIGPGQTLTGMIRRIDVGVRTYHVETKAEADEVIAALGK